jgi:hypothetical protein
MIDADVEMAVRLVESSAHVWARGVRGEKPQAEESRRFQPPNPGEAVRDAVGEMCPHPAPLLRFASRPWGGS